MRHKTLRDYCVRTLILLPFLLSTAACAANDRNKTWTVKNGSACPKEGMTARDTDGDASICKEDGQ